MTDAQGFAIFKCLLEYTVAQRNLPVGTHLDVRSYIEPVIDRMLDEARKQAVEEYKGLCVVDVPALKAPDGGM